MYVRTYVYIPSTYVVGAGRKRSGKKIDAGSTIGVHRYTPKVIITQYGLDRFNTLPALVSWRIRRGSLKRVIAARLGRSPRAGHDADAAPPCTPIIAIDSRVPNVFTITTIRRRIRCCYYIVLLYRIHL